MSEAERPAEEAHAVRQLAEAIGGMTLSLFEVQDFMGKKVAREIMDKEGLTDLFNNDDAGAAALEDMFGPMVAAGIGLAMFGRTGSEEAIAEAEQGMIAQLESELPAELRRVFTRRMRYFIEAGITFRNEHMKQRTEKFNSWYDELKLLRAMRQD